MCILFWLALKQPSLPLAALPLEGWWVVGLEEESYISLSLWPLLYPISLQ
jgi:hypothetical protein